MGEKGERDLVAVAGFFAAAAAWLQDHLLAEELRFGGTCWRYGGWMTPGGRKVGVGEEAAA